MRLNAFNGGLDTRKSDKHIKPNEAVECVNVDITSQELVSAKGLGVSKGAAVAPYYFEVDDEWVDDADTRDYLPYKGSLYWSGGEGLSVRKSGVDRLLGVATPEDIPFKAQDTRTALGMHLIQNDPTTGAILNDYWEVQQTVINTGSVTYLTPTGGSESTYNILIQVLVDGEPFCDVTKIIPSNPNNPSLPALGFDLTNYVTLINKPPNAVIKVGLIIGGDTYSIVELPNLIWDGAIPVNPTLLTELTITKNNNLLPPYSDYDPTSVYAPYTGDLWYVAAVKVDDWDGTSATNYKYIAIRDFVDVPVVWPVLPVGQTGGNWLRVVHYERFTENTYLNEHKARLYELNVSLGIFEGVDGDYSTLAQNNLEFLTSDNVQYCVRRSHNYTAYIDSNISAVNMPIPTLRIFGLPARPYQGYATYVYTLYDTVTGVESKASQISDYVGIDQGNYAENAQRNIVLFEGIPDNTAGLVIRLYRVGMGILQYTLVTELPVDSNYYVDNVANADMLGTLLPTDVAGIPPSGLRYLTNSGGMFFASIGDTLRFTDVYGNIEVWKETHYLDFDLTITGLSDSVSGLVVFTKYKTYLVTGNSPATLSVQLLSGDQGCVNHKTIVRKGGTLVFWSTDGICTLSGSSLDVVSKFKLTNLDYATVIQSTVHDEVYYTTTTGDTIAFDLRFAPAFLTYSFAVDWLAVGGDTLYSVSGGERREMFAGDQVTSTYKTGKFTEGADTEIKLYDEIYVSCDGTHDIIVYIDGIEVGQYTRTGADLSDPIKIPKSKQRGRNISFKISGVGTISEIEYKAEGRKNGN